MTTPKIKLCGLMREEDVLTANRLKPEYVGFVFVPGSRRFVTVERARELRRLLAPGITVVGVFLREPPESVASLLWEGIIDLPQLHGGEDESYLSRLRSLTDRPVLQAFRADTVLRLRAAANSTADMVLLDSGAGGSGVPLDWSTLRDFPRPFFLAGGLDPTNVAEAVASLRPYAVDVSSGIETDGRKDPRKMHAFVAAVRGTPCGETAR